MTPKFQPRTRHPAQASACVMAAYSTDCLERASEFPIPANLRRHFEVDRFHIAHAATAALAAEGKMTGNDVARAIRQYKLDADEPNPLFSV